MMQWTRATHGRVWHITFGDGPILCNSELRGAEFVWNLPRGAVPCGPCRDAIETARRHALAAVEETSDGAIGEPLPLEHAPEPPADITGIPLGSAG